jgi:signal transduction histidine kinase
MRREHVKNTTIARGEGAALGTRRMESYVPFETYLLSAEPVWVWDSDKRRIVWANAAARAALGVADNAALAKLPSPAKSQSLRRINTIARKADGSGQWNGSLNFSLPSGETSLPCQLQKLEMNGGARGVIVRLHEPASIRIRPKAPRKRAAAKSRATPKKIHIETIRPTIEQKPVKRKAYRMNAAGLTYLAGLTHDLRNPLSAIVGFASILKTANADLPRDKIAEYAGDIAAAAAHALDLAQDALNFVHRGPTPARDGAVDAAQTLDDCLRLVAPLMEQAGLTAMTSAPHSLPVLRMPERALKQVLLNILLNSVKFTAAGGLVKVKAAVQPNGLTISIDDSGGEHGDSLKLNGAGSVPGQGLGLAMSKRLLKEAGAKLSRRKRKNGGVAVKLIFPLSSFLERTGEAA